MAEEKTNPLKGPAGQSGLPADATHQALQAGGSASMASQKPLGGDDKNMGALFIPAGILIGVGIGFLTGNLPAWMFIGLGTGFLGFAITYLVKKK